MHPYLQVILWAAGIVVLFIILMAWNNHKWKKAQKNRIKIIFGKIPERKDTTFKIRMRRNSGIKNSNSDILSEKFVFLCVRTPVVNGLFYPFHEGKAFVFFYYMPDTKLVIKMSALEQTTRLLAMQ